MSDRIRYSEYEAVTNTQPFAEDLGMTIERCGHHDERKQRCLRNADHSGDCNFRKQERRDEQGNDNWPECSML
jgi:hypothetical protein